MFSIMTSVKFYLRAYSSWKQLDTDFFEIYCTVINPELEVNAIYSDFGLNFAHQDQSLRVVTSAKCPRSFEYNEIFLSVPVINKNSPE